MIDIPAGRSGRQRWPCDGNTCAVTTFRMGESFGQRSVGERGLLVAGPAPHSHRADEDDAAQAPLPAYPVSGMGETPPLKAVTHACEARTRFGIVASTTGRVRAISVVASGSGQPGPFCFGKPPPYHRENGCATRGLQEVKNRCTLDIANLAAREDVSK